MVFDLHAAIKNSLENFIQDCCETGDWKSIDCHLLYERYSEWCKTKQIPVQSTTAVGRFLNSAGYAQTRRFAEKKQTRGWYGITLKA